MEKTLLENYQTKFKEQNSQLSITLGKILPQKESRWSMGYKSEFQPSDLGLIPAWGNPIDITYIDCAHAAGKICAVLNLGLATAESMRPRWVSCW